MTTAKDLVDEISANLHGFGNTADRVTPLTANIGPSDTQFTVDFTSGTSVGIAAGVIEIDSELLYVTSVDTTTGTITLAHGFGRGYGDTTAASHSAGARVTSRPKFPRVWLLKQLNGVIGSLYPQVFGVGTFQTTVQFPGNTYTLPGSPGMILDAQWQDPIGNWQRCQSYTSDPYDATFRLGSGAMVGRPLRIVYAKEPTQFTDETTDFTTTGLPDSCADLLVMGVIARSAPGLDISRAQTTSVEQSDRSRVVPPNAGVTYSKYLMQMYLERLQNEAQSLRKRYPSRLVKVW